MGEGGGGEVRVNVNEELKFFVNAKKRKKMGGGGLESRIRMNKNEKMTFL